MIEEVDKETEVFQKKRKLSVNDKTDKLLETALKTLETPLNNDERFGQYVAMELSEISNISIKKKLKREIRKAIIAAVEEDDMTHYPCASSPLNLNEIVFNDSN